MSVICERSSWCFVDEEHFINNNYSATLNNSHMEQYTCQPRMFEINEKFVCDSHYAKASYTSIKKRKRHPSEEFSECELLLQSNLKEVSDMAGHLCSSPVTVHPKDNNKDARNLQRVVETLQNIFQVDEESKDQEIIDDVNDICNLDLARVTSCLVSNPHKVSVMKEISSEKYLIPPRSTFLLSDITRTDPIIDADLLFDCIVMDPPWQNKSVKRKRTYNSMPMFDLKMLPMRNLCSEGCLVVVWVTNKRKLQDYIVNEFFPSCRISPVAVWHWLKVTKSLAPVVPLNSSGKKPYEKLVLGRYGGIEGRTTERPKVPDDFAIISVPSAIHSHKPPLADVLKKYLPNNAKCLELFARSLQPGWCSWGNEVLLLQNEKLFIRCSQTDMSDNAEDNVNRNQTGLDIISV